LFVHRDLDRAFRDGGTSPNVLRVWITQREAAFVLAEIGLGRAQARQLLTCGLAGPGLRTSGAVLYEADRVRDLATRAFVDEGTLAGACPRGIYVARLARAASFDASLPWSVRAQMVACQPSMPPMTRALIAARVAAIGSIPWIVTICGFVALGADAVQVMRDHGGGTAFRLEEPGPWFDMVEGRCFPTGRGRHWVLWLPRPL
jgi:hypothetical protein